MIPRRAVVRIAAVVLLAASLSQGRAAENEFLPAFPGAEGFGARATGGRGGRVIAVTNLEDSGPGSLRAALAEKGPRTVVFRVSGTIELKSNLSLKHGDLTVAGQTAPGDGICLKNYALGFDGASNVIVRYLRIRPGDAAGRELDAMGGRSGENIIVDHCSASWSIDECVSFYGAIRNLTVQWCVVAESLYQSAHAKGRHGFGGIWGGDGASWHHNLVVHHSSRNPRLVGKSPVPQLVDIRNNVIYNWGYNSTYGGDGDVRVNLVNNVYRPGPATRANVRSRLANPSAGTVARNWWIDGNLAVGAPEVTADNWRGVHPAAGATAETLRAPATFPVAPVITQPAAEVLALVLREAGAVLPRRDALDARLVEETRTGTARFGETYDGGGRGIIDSPRSVGGWPELRSAEAPADADGDGYTNLEEFLNGTDPTVFVAYRVRT